MKIIMSVLELDDVTMSEISEAVSILYHTALFFIHGRTFELNKNSFWAVGNNKCSKVVCTALCWHKKITIDDYAKDSGPGMLYSYVVFTMSLCAL